LRRINAATMSLVALAALTNPRPVTPASVWTSTIWMPPGSVRGCRDALYRFTVTSLIFTTQLLSLELALAIFRGIVALRHQFEDRVPTGRAARASGRRERAWESDDG